MPFVIFPYCANRIGQQALKDPSLVVVPPSDGNEVPPKTPRISDNKIVQTETGGHCAIWQNAPTFQDWLTTFPAHADGVHFGQKRNSPFFRISRRERETMKR